jgi:DNA (cytosine-5)-methyltransferase 1
MLRTLGSVFSGIGGFELGLHPLGIEPVWQVEQDLFCRKVLQKHWPDVHKFVRIENVVPQSLPYVDIIAGGFPCQPVSISGKQKGSSDSRWLWPEFFRIVRYVRPKYVIIENVPGLLTTNGGKDFETILNNLAEIRYDAEWECIPASSIGARHKRNRLFIVAYPECFRLAKRKVFDKNTFEKFTAIAGNSSFYRTTPDKDTLESEVCRVSDGISRSVDRVVNTRAIKTRRTVPYKSSIRFDLESYTVDAYERSEAAFRLGKPISTFTIKDLDWAFQSMRNDDFWGIEPPELCRVAGELPNRKERLTALGNAVVPQLVTVIGNCIKEHYSLIGREYWYGVHSDDNEM